LQGLRAAIGRASDLSIVAEGGTAAEAKTLARDVSPNILLIDVHLPGNGIDAARHIAIASPNVKIVIMTGSEDDTLVGEAVAVHAGERYIGHSLAARLVFQRQQAQGGDPQKKAVKLSARENHIMQLVTSGMTNSDISDELGLSARTVGNYVSGIYAKLGAKNRCAAILMYRRLCVESSSRAM
jgi:two-component system, NarL family, nitrate/nitrite response regulator NarL